MNIFFSAMRNPVPLLFYNTLFCRSLILRQQTSFFLALLSSPHFLFAYNRTCLSFQMSKSSILWLVYEIISHIQFFVDIYQVLNTVKISSQDWKVRGESGVYEGRKKKYRKKSSFGVCEMWKLQVLITIINFNGNLLKT